MDHLVDGRQKSRGVWFWTTIGWILSVSLVVGFVWHKLHQLLQDDSEELQVAFRHVSIAWHHICVILQGQFSEWVDQVVLSSRTFLRSSLALLGSLRSQVLTAGVVGLMGAMMVGILLLWYVQRRRSILNGRSTNVEHGGDDGMEILRNTRARASTFDFFGTHSTWRERSNGSIGDLSRGGGGGGEVGGDSNLFRRERMGSMDLYYSHRFNTADDSIDNDIAGGPKQHHQTQTVQQPKTTKQKNKNKKKNATKQRGPKRKLSFATTPSNGDMPHDAFFAQQAYRSSVGGEEGNSEDEGYLFDEFGLVTLSYDIVYYGPTHTALHYETWTPPTSWTEVSRRIIPQDIMLKLRRNLLLDMNQAKVTVKEPKSSDRWDFSSPAQDFSIHVEPPVEGAVMNLYVKGTPKEEWMEHTFESAQMAAQFQLDLLAYQVLGRTLNNLYQALSLVHSGSQAYDGPEFVLHHNVAEGRDQDDDSSNAAETQRTTSLSGVTWDDAMRALSSIPTIRIALERLWLHQRRPTDGFSARKKSASLSQKEISEPEDTDGLLTEEYAGKRFLLGPVDFFRLFVPALSDTALPQSEANRGRMEQLLSWRKRAARAAILIREYVISHRVVNVGWHLIRPNPVEDQPRTLSRRLAFDDNEQNNRRDAQARYELYEASVSRDVLCHVRPFDYFDQLEINPVKNLRRGLVLSPYQAYALVGVHVFRKPQEYDPAFPLNPSRDPVDSISSLHKLITDNPDQDFFVTCYHRNDAVTIMLYARSLAQGIDAHFDNVITRFTNGNKEVRDRKVHMMIQMGQSQSLSFLGMLLVRFLSFLFSLTKKGQESPMSLQARRDRIPFPAIRIASYGETYHFGGVLQDNNDLPKNYVAMSMAFTAKGMPNLVSQFLFAHLNEQMSEQVLDFTLVLEGERKDELPERALCTTRMVRVDTAAVAITPAMNEFRKERELGGSRRRLLSEQGGLNIWSRRVASGVASAIRSSLIVSAWGGNPNEAVAVVASPKTLQLPKGMKSPRYEDAIEGAINEVTALLKGVQVPIRRNYIHGLPGGAKHFSRISTVLPEGMMLVPVLDTVSRHDIKRFVSASGCNIKMAAVRIVQTSGWRGRVFPVDIRGCRIELQNGQFFQQGRDRSGNPVFYFSTMCRGPWRRNPEATLSAALHRFETAISELCTQKSDTRCTLVLILGHSKGAKNSTGTPGEEGNGSDVDDEEGEEEDHKVEEDQNETTVAMPMDRSNGDSQRYLSNPRVPTEEAWKLHSTKDILEEFISLLVFHYPERIAQIFLVKGKGGKPFYRTKVDAARAMKHCIASSDARGRITFLQILSRLKIFIDEAELSEAAGGSAPVLDTAFDFC